MEIPPDLPPLKTTPPLAAETPVAPATPQTSTPPATGTAQTDVQIPPAPVPKTEEKKTDAK